MITNSPLISVILPIYNAEYYLAKCLDSIIQQSYSNLEIIVVIDGATDRSYKIAKEYSKKDCRIITIYQENQGSGPARNTGLKVSNGDFVVFVDPDDWCEVDYIQTLFLYQQKYSVDFITSKSKMILFSKNGKVKHLKNHTVTFEYIKGLDNVRNSFLRLSENNLVGAPHCKLYNNHIIKDNLIEFPDLRRSQDLIFNIRYFSHISSVCVIPESKYNYRIEFLNRLHRIKKDYCNTISYLYTTYESYFSQWGISYKKEQLCSKFFSFIEVWLEALISRNEKIDSLWNDAILQEIISNSEPSKYLSKFVQYLILKKHIKFLVLLFKLKHFIKKYFGYA